MPISTATIIEAGRRRTATAKTWPTMPRSGQHQVDGSLNGKPYRFIQTHGKGQGDTEMFYAYVEYAGQVWYIETGDGSAKGLRSILPGRRQPGTASP